MADLKQGSPKITAPDAFGGVQQITIDSNRPSVAAESLFRFANMIALPSRGLYSDFLLWPLATATFTRLIYHAASFGIVSPFAGVAFLAFVFLPLITVITYAGAQLDKTHGTFCLYRLFQIALGFGLALL